jgi:hypothetical protein
MYPCICTYNLCLGGRYCNICTVYIMVIHKMPKIKKSRDLKISITLTSK